MKVKAQNKQKVEYLVSCIVAEKDSIDLLSRNMEIHVHGGEKKKAKKEEKLLREHINKYNVLAKEYKKLTGEKIELASTSMASDIKKGNAYQTLPKFVYDDGTTPVAHALAPSVAKAAKLVNRKDLNKILDKNTKELAGFKGEFNDLVVNKVEATGQQKVLGIVNCLTVQKLVVDKTAENLIACCQVSDVKKTNQYKKSLASEIKTYNDLVNEYEKLTGGKLTRAAKDMPECIIEGKTYSPIPTISYTVGDSTAAADAENAAKTNYNKAKNHHEADKNKVVATAKTALEAKIAEQANKDLSVLTKCADYKVSMFESERDMTSYKFGGPTVNTKKVKKQLAKKIAAVKKEHKSALAFENLDNDRYYAIVKNDPKNLKLKNVKDRSKVESLRSRMIVLLNKRDEINGKLIAIYTGTEVNIDGTSVNQKWRNVKNDAAEKAIKKDKKLAKRVKKLKASEGEKHSIYNKMNQKLDATSTLALSEYRLKKEKNTRKENKALKKDVKENKAAVKQYNEDIKWMIKKTKERNATKSWGVGFVIVLVVLVAAAAVAGKLLNLY